MEFGGVIVVEIHSFDSIRRNSNQKKNKEKNHQRNHQWNEFFLEKLKESDKQNLNRAIVLYALYFIHVTQTKNINSENDSGHNFASSIEMLIISFL